MNQPKGKFVISDYYKQQCWGYAFVFMSITLTALFSKLLSVVFCSWDACSEVNDIFLMLSYSRAKVIGMIMISCEIAELLDKPFSTMRAYSAHQSMFFCFFLIISKLDSRHANNCFDVFYCHLLLFSGCYN